MKEFFARLKTDSPKYFKRISFFGKWLAATGAVLMTAAVAAPETIHEGIISIMKIVCGYMIFGGTIISAISNLTVADYSELEEKLKKDE